MPSAFAYATIARSGECYRVADPSWLDPLDTSYSGQRGGRWNPPPLEALYLNASKRVALANARRHVESIFAASLDDVRDDRLPDLQYVEINDGGTFLDAVTPHGISLLQLPATYPSGVPHEISQTIGLAASRVPLDGIVPLSAMAPEEEELVIFENAKALLVTRGRREPFTQWANGIG